MGKRVKADNSKAAAGNLDKRRSDFLEMASITNTILEKRYFGDLMNALDKDSRDSFEKLCDTAKIPNPTRTMLWDTLKKAYTESGKEAPWLC